MSLNNDEFPSAPGNQERQGSLKQVDKTAINRNTRNVIPNIMENLSVSPLSCLSETEAIEL
tara:strand:- start:961 stop:1143 length:183 start_codon:yes stop_codon:yes gene_type:complete